MRATARRDATMLRAMPLSVARSPALSLPTFFAYSRASRSSFASSRSMSARGGGGGARAAAVGGRQGRVLSQERDRARNGDALRICESMPRISLRSSDVHLRTCSFSVSALLAALADEPNPNMLRATRTPRARGVRGRRAAAWGARNAPGWARDQLSRRHAHRQRVGEKRAPGNARNARTQSENAHPCRENIVAANGARRPP